MAEQGSRLASLVAGSVASWQPCSCFARGSTCTSTSRPQRSPTASTRRSAALSTAPESPHFTGCVAYRGLVPADRLSNLDLEVTAQIWMGPGKHFVHYFVQHKRLGKLRRDRRARHLDTRVVDRSGRARGCACSVRGLASAGSLHPGSGRGDVHLGALRSRSARALVDRPHDVAWGCVPSDAAVHGGGCRTGDRGRRDARCGPEQKDRGAQMARGSTDWSGSAVAWLYGHDASAVENNA